jgi:hypothetical protein
MARASSGEIGIALLHSSSTTGIGYYHTSSVAIALQQATLNVGLSSGRVRTGDEITLDEVERIAI